MRRVTRVAIALGVMVWLCGLAPAAARGQENPPAPPDPCIGGNPNGGNVPFCNSSIIQLFEIDKWGTIFYDFTCTDPNYPYAWATTYTQTGYASVSLIGIITYNSPGTYAGSLTNWNPFQTDRVKVRLACSKSNSFGGECGGPVSDPGCPVVEGSQHNYCSGGPVPVCFQTYQERCQPGNQLYQCTIDLGIAYCLACPG